MTLVSRETRDSQVSTFCPPMENDARKSIGTMASIRRKKHKECRKSSIRRKP